MIKTFFILNYLLLILAELSFAGVKWARTTNIEFNDDYDSIYQTKNKDILAAGSSGSHAVLSRYTYQGKLLWQSHINDSTIHLSAVTELDNEEILVVGQELKSKKPVDWDLVAVFLSRSGETLSTIRYPQPISTEVSSGMLSMGANNFLIYGAKRENINAPSVPMLVRFNSINKTFEDIDISTFTGLKNGTITNMILNQEKIIMSMSSFDKKSISHLIQLSPTFKIEWKLLMPAVSDNVLTSLALSKDKSILVGGYTSTNGYNSTPYVSRISSNGIILWTNYVATQPSKVVNALIEDRDNHIIVSAGSYKTGEPGQYATIYKLSAAGLPIKSYPLNSTEAGEAIHSLLLGEQNQVIFGGYSWIPEGLNSYDGYVGVMELN